jgi:hypothetical protein
MGTPQLSGKVQMKYLIKGITSEGKTFRPSDWSERLCSVLSYCTPDKKTVSNAPGYSPYVKPIMVNDVRCVLVDSKLVDVEPRALDFVLNFAKDNDLTVIEDCQKVVNIRDYMVA